MLWLADGTRIDLNHEIASFVGWSSAENAMAISDTGVVSGLATYSPGGITAPYRRAFALLVPFAGTYGRGDANFDTHVDFDDLLILAQHYGETNATQNVHVGDFDLDGSIDFDDLLALAQHYEASPALVDTGAWDSSFAADWALARSIIPEPVSVGVVCMLGLLARGRRA